MFLVNKEYRVENVTSFVNTEASDSFIDFLDQY